MFCKINLNAEVIVKSVVDPDNNFSRNVLKQLWVKIIFIG